MRVSSDNIRRDCSVPQLYTSVHWLNLRHLRIRRIHFKVFIGGILVAVHLHVRHVALLGTDVDVLVDGHEAARGADAATSQHERSDDENDEDGDGGDGDAGRGARAVHAVRTLAHWRLDLLQNTIMTSAQTVTAGVPKYCILLLTVQR